MLIAIGEKPFADLEHSSCLPFEVHDMDLSDLFDMHALVHQYVLVLEFSIISLSNIHIF